MRIRHAASIDALIHAEAGTVADEYRSLRDAQVHEFRSAVERGRYLALVRAWGVFAHAERFGADIGENVTPATEAFNPVCSACGDANLVRDAAARWDEAAQDWTISDVDDAPLRRLRGRELRALPLGPGQPRSRRRCDCGPVVSTPALAIEAHRPPVVAAWGMGVDSTAMIIELVERGEPPDLVLTADTGSERPETYDYRPLFQRWMDEHDVTHAVCRYVPQRFKHWPPYFSLLENCLTNATLPSIAFARHSCSLKWKVEPQDRYVAGWAPAQAAWARGERVCKLIGFDASPADSRRYAHAEGIFSPLYSYRYPLREWGWDRVACAKRIRAAGLPVPIKSSCFFCSAMKPAEVLTLPRWCLRLIILLEARAAPRLRTVEGLWRRSTSTRPGTMTAFIRAERLLDETEIDAIIEGAPVELVRFQAVAADLPVEERPALAQWLDRFNAGVTRLAA